MEYISAPQAAKKWKIGVRRVQYYCANEMIPGVIFMGKQWIIPKDAEKPVDCRKKEVKTRINEVTYRFPMMIFTNMFVAHSDASDIEMILMKAQLYHFKGDFFRSNNMAQYVIRNTLDTNLLMGAYSTMAFSHFAKKEEKEANDCFQKMKELANKENIHKEDFKLIVSSYDCLVNGRFEEFFKLDPSKMGAGALRYYECLSYQKRIGESESDLLHAKIFAQTMEIEGSTPSLLIILSEIAKLAERIHVDNEANEYKKKAILVAEANGWNNFVNTYFKSFMEM